VEAVPGSGGLPLDGLGIRLVHVDRRRADAEEAARRLRALGATVELFETSDSDNEGHTGALAGLGRGRSTISEPQRACRVEPVHMCNRLSYDEPPDWRTNMRVQAPLLRRASLLCAVAVLTLALPAMAEETAVAAQPQTPTTAPAPTAETVQPVAAAGMVAYIDPVTGGHTSNPTPEQRAEMRAALAAALNRSEEGLYDVVLPDGTVMRDLQGRFQNAVVVRRGPDGTLTYDCVTNVEGATAAPAPPATEPPAAVAVE